MEFKCLHDKEKDLQDYPFRSLRNSKQAVFGLLTLGKSYFVTGMAVGDGYVSYLLDDFGTVGAFHSRLFEVIDPKIPPSWYFQPISKESSLFPFHQAYWGYRGFCFEKDHYVNIVEGEEATHRTYFKRKIQMEEEWRFE